MKRADLRWMDDFLWAEAGPDRARVILRLADDDRIGSLREVFEAVAKMPKCKGGHGRPSKPEEACVDVLVGDWRRRLDRDLDDMRSFEWVNGDVRPRYKPVGVWSDAEEQRRRRIAEIMEALTRLQEPSSSARERARSE